jgi:transcription antitermination factor NusG
MVERVLDDPTWWALYTRHQHEKTVAEMLSFKGIEVLLPLYEAKRRWKDREKLQSLPLFPGYLFVHTTYHRKLQVLSTPGVHMILHRGQEIATIPDHEIEAIQKAVGMPAKVEPHPYLECGTRVRVISGPLEGVCGIFVRKKNVSRLVLSVDTLAQSVSVEVFADDVEPCNAESEIGAAYPSSLLRAVHAESSLDNAGSFSAIYRGCA